VNRRLDGTDLGFLHRAAYTGGIDFLRRWDNKKWYVAGTGSGSRVEGDPQALLLTQTSSARYFQRPDNDYESVDPTRTTLNGHAGSLRLGRSGGGDWRFETGGAWRSPGFEINDAGFMRRADEVNQFSWLGWSRRNPFAIFRRMGINGNQWLDWDFGGTLLSRMANSNFNMNFLNNWAFGGGATRTWERVSNTELRGGPSSLWPGGWDTNFWCDTDYRKDLAASFGANFTDLDEGTGRFRNGWIDITYRPSNALRLVLSPSYSRNLDELQYVSTSGTTPHYVFGRLSQETAALTVRFDYTIRPNLTVQFYGAPFVSAGDYTTFKRVESPRAEQLDDRFHFYDSSEIQHVPASGGVGAHYLVNENGDQYAFGDPNFDVRDFNSNLVTRWEYQPGSVIYLVWSQSRSEFVPTGDFALGRDARGLFDNHPHNVFLVKISKWFSL
jgi:hypothetical protein